MPKNSETAAASHDTPALRIRVDGAIATVTIDRREVHNALTHDVLDAIEPG